MTAGMGYVAAVLLAGALSWASVVKLRAPHATRRSFADLGLPAPAVLTRAVPVTELGVALALVLRPAIGAVAALVMLAAFTTLLVTTIASGRDVGCGCFGANASEPVTWVSVLRNAMLGSLAFAALTVTRPTRPDLADVIVTSTVAASALVLLALADLRRKIGHVIDNRLAGEQR